MNKSACLSGLERLQQLLSSRNTSIIILESSISVIMFLLAFTGNLLVLLVVYKTPRLRNAAGIFITSLAISDIAVVMLGCPLNTSALIAGRWVAGFFLCQISGYSVPFFASASLQTMALMALDRFYRISNPIKHRTTFTVKRSKTMAVLVWLVASTVNFPYVATGEMYTFHPGKGICFVNFSLSASTGITYLVLPSMILSHFYMKVFQALRANKRRVKNLEIPGNGSHRLTLQEIKLTRTLLVTVVGFAICWTPVLIIDIVDISLGGWALPREVYMLYSFCGITSACINPLIYGAMNRVFRQEYIRLLGLTRFTKSTHCTDTPVNRLEVADQRLADSVPASSPRAKCVIFLPNPDV